MEVKVLKRYPYRGIDIVVRAFGRELIEYLFCYKNGIYTQSYDLHVARNKYKEIGAATLIVCQAAENVADLVIHKHRKWYNPKRYIASHSPTPKVEHKTTANNEESHDKKEGTDQGH